MPFELSEGTLNTDEWEFDENADGDGVITHKSTGAKFVYNSTEDQWEPSGGIKTPVVDSNVTKHATDISEDYTIGSGKGAVFAGPITGSGSISGNGQVSVIQEGTTFTDNVDAQGNDINNVGSLDANTSTINQKVGFLSKNSTQTLVSGSNTTVSYDSAEIEDSAVLDIDLPNNKVIIQKSGRYSFGGYVSFSAFNTLDSSLGVEIRINGSLDKSADGSGNINTNRAFGVPIATYPVDLTVGDEITIVAKQANPSNFDESMRADQRRSFWMIERLG
jgi:hypothetical protein